MAIIINDNYSLQAVNKAFDARYLNINTPWTSCAAAIAGIPTYRYPGLTININNSEWWWKDGIGDSDLVPKTLGGTSNLSGATNGLTKVGQNVCLGGSLIQGTDIYGDGNNFQLGTSTRRINNLTFNSSGSTIINSGTNSVAIGQADMIITDSINSKGLEYADSYENNFTTCSLVSKKYVDDKANVVNVCQISTAYTTLRNDELIAVSGISSNEIFLYATPVIGQRLTVVDICGNAFVEPIVVNGNGHNINDGICSTINTDYGSVTYVFNGIFWSAVAFIN